MWGIHLIGQVAAPVPPAFTVEYVNGKSELLERGAGVAFVPAADDPTGRANFHADIPRRSRHQQKQYRRVACFDQVKRIVSPDGAVLWERAS